MAEYKIKGRATAHGVLFGLFPFSRSGVEIVKANSATEAIVKLRNQFEAEIATVDIDPEDVELEILDVEKL